MADVTRLRSAGRRRYSSRSFAPFSVEYSLTPTHQWSSNVDGAAPAFATGSPRTPISCSFDGPVMVIRVVNPELARWRSIRAAVSQASRCSVVVVDLTALASLDSVGVQTLLDLQRSLRGQPAQLRVVASDAQLPPGDQGLDCSTVPIAVYPTVEAATAQSSPRPVAVGGLSRRPSG